MLILTGVVVGQLLAQSSPLAPGWHWNRQTESLNGIFAQPGLSVFHLSFEKEGSGGIRYVWISTSQGLYRYDGYTAVRFGKENGLPSDFVRCSLATSKGQLWVGTDSGAGVFDGKNFFSSGSETGLAGPNVRRMIEDRFGTIWFASDSWPKAGVAGGIASLRDGQWKAYHERDGLPSGYVVDQFTDSKGRIFAMTSGGPARLVGERWVPEPFGPLPVNTHWGSAAMVETPGTGVILSNGFATWVLREDGWKKLGTPPLHNHGIAATRDGKAVIAGGTRPAFMAFFEWTDAGWKQVSDEFRVPQSWGIHLAEAPDGSIWYAGLALLQRWPRAASEWRVLPGSASVYKMDDGGRVWGWKDQRLSEWKGGQWVDRGLYDVIWNRESTAIWGARAGRIFKWSADGSEQQWSADGLEQQGSGVGVPSRQRQRENGRTGLPIVLSVGVDRNRVPWAVGSNGAGKGLVAYFDGGVWRTHPFPHPGVGHNVFQAPAAGGGMWYLTRGSSVQWQLVRVKTDWTMQIHTVPNGAIASFVNDLDVGPAGEVYVFGESGLHRFSEQQGWSRLDSRSARRVVSVGFHGGRGWMVLHEALGLGDGLAPLDPAGPFQPLEQATYFRGGYRNALLSGGKGQVMGVAGSAGSEPFSIAVPGAPQVLLAEPDTQGAYWLSTSDGFLRFRPDGVAPDTSLAAVAEKVVSGQPLTASAKAIQRFSLAEESVSFSWRLDRGEWSPFLPESQRLFASESLAVGTHTLEVRARDQGLDIDPSPAAISFQVLALPLQDRKWFPAALLAMMSALGISLYAALDSSFKLRQRTALENKINLERYRHIVQTAQEGIAILDADGHCTLANAEFARIVGKPLEALPGMHFQEFVAKGRVDSFRELFEQQKQGKAATYETAMEFEHGVQHVLASLRPIPSHDGSFQGALASLTDIGPKKQAEEAVRQSAENYRLLFEDSLNPRLVVDRATAAILLANQAACRLYGYEKPEFTRWTLLDLQPPEGVESAKLILANPSPSEAFQRRHKKRDGTVFEVEIFAHDLEFEGRACRNMLVIDKTQSILAASRLQESREALAMAQSIASVGSFDVTYRNGQVTRSWSDELFRIAGLPVGEREAPDWFTFVHPDDLAEATMIRDALLSSGEPRTFEHRILRTDGVERRARAIVQAQPVADGMRLFGTVQDVTELRAMQEQLQQAQRLDSIGRLAGGIAHDFNNLLTVINGYSKLLLQKLASQPDIRADVEQIAEAGREAAELTKRLLAFGRKQLLKPASLQLAEVIGQALPLLRRLAGGNVRIETRLDPEAIVHADRVQMNQVLVNLTANARDAMPAGGVLTFEVVRNGGFVVLSVSDTGEGMSAAVVDRIFEPFFSTKERTGGTGLGLSSVYGIVLQSGGTIQCFSEPGRGTRFEIRLPAATTPDGTEFSTSVGERQSAPLEERIFSAKRVLVVDDQADVRKFVLEVLSKHGYEVVAVADGPAALEELAKPDGRWDLVLTDVVMPGMTGPELASEARRAPWGAKVPMLFMSGYTGAEFDFLIRSDTAGAFLLEKPFSPEALLEAVHKAIAASNPRE